MRPKPPSRSAKRRSSSRAAVRFVRLSLALSLAWTFTACQLDTSESAQDATGAASAAPVLYTLRGSIALETGADPTGSIVFCAGRSYAAYADAEGAYAISSVPPGAYTLAAQKPGFETLVIGEFILEANPADPAALDFAVPAAEPLRQVALASSPTQPVSPTQQIGGLGSLRGVVRAAGSASAEAIRVRIDETSQFTSPGPSGAFDLRDIRPGAYRVFFELEGYDTEIRGVTIQPDQVTQLQDPVLLRPASEAEADTPTIIGRVLFIDSSGQIIEYSGEVLVRIVELQLTDTTGADGTFMFEELKPGRYTLTAEAPGFALQRDVTVVVGDGATPAILVLQEKTAVLIGTIDLADRVNESLAGSQVALPGTGFSGLTDASGRFRLTGVPAGAYSLLCLRSGYKTLEVSNVAAKAGDITDLGTLTLERDVELARVLGTVPEDGTRGWTILPENVLRVTFSKRMNLALLQSAITIAPECAWTLDRAGGAGASDGRTDAVDITISNLASSSAPLRFDTRYTVTIPREAEDAEGNPMQDGYAFTFETGGLTVLHSYPPDGAANISVQGPSRLILYFNGIVDEQTVSDRSVDVRPRPDAKSLLVRFQTDEETGWTIYHSAPVVWSADTKYTVRLSGIRAKDGTRLDPATQRVNFRTDPTPEFQSTPIEQFK